MGKYTSMSKQKETPRITGVNPVMKGLGCIIMLIVPPLSYAFSMLLTPIVATRGILPFPPEWMGFVRVPAFLRKLEGLTPLYNLIESQEHLMATIVVALAIMVVIGGIMAIFFGYLYKFLGPSQYGPTDVPPIRVKVKRYKR